MPMTDLSALRSPHPHFRPAAAVLSPVLTDCDRFDHQKALFHNEFDKAYVMPETGHSNHSERLPLSRFVSLSANSYQIHAKIDHQILAASAVKSNMPNGHSETFDIKSILTEAYHDIKPNGSEVRTPKSDPPTPRRGIRGPHLASPNSDPTKPARKKSLFYYFGPPIRRGNRAGPLSPAVAPCCFRGVICSVPLLG
ncbi:MAG: hypothetical protein JWO87_1776 [Phycisphaerales bacterium]|nr:hypothetical protein [Phycisphaerales bacterium]